TGGRKHPELRLRELSGTDQKDRSRLQVEKHRQKSHVTLASPITGYARIVFFTGGFQAPQRENYYSLLRCTHGISTSGNPSSRHAFSQKMKSIFEPGISSSRAAASRCSTRVGSG